MSPTEFSNYIKQRQQLQQNNTYHHQPNHHQNMYGLSVSPARSMSPNPVTLQMSSNDPFVFPSNGFNLNMYQSFGSPRNMFEGINGGNYNQYNNVPNVGNDAFVLAAGKCSSIMDQQQSFCKIPSQQMPPNSQATLQATQLNTSISKNIVNSSIDSNSSNNPQSQMQDSKLLDGISSFYSSSNASYQHLLVANWMF